MMNIRILLLLLLLLVVVVVIVVVVIVVVVVVVVVVVMGGTRWCSGLRHCATSRNVAGSIPDSVIGIFH